MLTIQDWLRQNNQLKNQFKQDISHADLRLLMGFLLSHDNAWIFANQNHVLNDHQIKQLNQWIKQLIDGYPIAYITGQQLFWDLDLKVNTSTLIPRADSETLIETALKLLANKQPKLILDLGTGSGALALALAKLFPNAEITGTDQSTAALEVATQNASKNQIDNIHFVKSDWFKNMTDLKFDLIVSNPPYIAADDIHLAALKHEPMNALIADENGLGDFIRIIQQAHEFLMTQGILMFEHGWQQKVPVHNLMQAAEYKNIQTVKDLGGNDRVTYGFKPDI